MRKIFFLLLLVFFYSLFRNDLSFQAETHFFSYAFGGVLFILVVFGVYRYIKSIKDQLASKKKEMESLQYKRLVNDQQINNCIVALLNEKNRILADKEEVLKQQEILITDLAKRNFRNLIEETNIYKRIYNIKEHNKKGFEPAQKLINEDWKELKTEIIHLKPDFIASLHFQNSRLEEKDIHFLCLMKIGFEYIDMQYIYFCTLSGVYKRAQKVKSRMNIGLGIDLKGLISSL